MILVQDSADRLLLVSFKRQLKALEMIVELKIGIILSRWKTLDRMALRPDASESKALNVGAARWILRCCRRGYDLQRSTPPYIKWVSGRLVIEVTSIQKTEAPLARRRCAGFHL